MPSDRAVFLDRDGTINRNRYYPDSASSKPTFSNDLELYPWSIPALKALNKRTIGCLSCRINRTLPRKCNLASLAEYTETLIELKRSDIYLWIAITATTTRSRRYGVFRMCLQEPRGIQSSRRFEMGLTCPVRGWLAGRRRR